jgi:hypothetical protein
MAAFKPSGARVSEPIMSPAEDFVAPSTLRIVIGKQSADVDSEKTALFTLPTKPRHLIEIWQNDTRKLSFWLKFSDYSSKNLCLWHKPLYGTISVIEASDPRCACNADKQLPL